MMHLMDKDGSSLCGSPSLDRTTDATMVDCRACRQEVYARTCGRPEPVICSVKEEERPALDKAMADAIKQRLPVLLPEGVSLTQNPLYIRVGNVEIIGQPGKSDPRGIPTTFRILVNGKPVACRNVSIEGGVDRFWQVRLDFLPAEEKGGD